MDLYKLVVAMKLTKGGGGSETQIDSLSVSENGTYTAEEGHAYSPVSVNVPNSYGSSDEGKVVSNGALVAQTSATKTANGTYDTTTNNSVTVNVPQPSGSISITQNGTVDVAQYASALVNVSGGGGGAVTLLGSAEFTVNTSSTSTQQVGTISCGEGAFTKDKLIWVHVRDKVGKRANSFYGSDLFFINTNAENGSTSAFMTCGILTLRCTSDNKYSIATTMAGVFGNNIQNDGTIIINSRYNATYSLTVDSTYICEVYAVDCPSTLFD